MNPTDLRLTFAALRETKAMFHAKPQRGRKDAKGLTMFERLIANGNQAAERKVRVVRQQLSIGELPDGVAVVPSESGIILSGRGLRMRLVRDVRLRTFADLVRRMLP